jgi:hypothetical protein
MHPMEAVRIFALRENSPGNPTLFTKFFVTYFHHKISAIQAHRISALKQPKPRKKHLKEHSFPVA